MSKSPYYMPIVRKAAQSYFREDDAPIGCLKNVQFRAFVDAVHRAYSVIEDETARDFIAAVYRNPSRNFYNTVYTQAQAAGIKISRAWTIVSRFIEDAAKRVEL